MATTTTTASDQSAASRVVRFDSECVLIPDFQRVKKRPIIITKSYSLPLWKRTKQPSDSDTPDEPSSPVLKVPFPNFKASKPTYSRSPTRAEPTSPLSPCLVHRYPSSPHIDGASPVSPRKLERRSSLPESPILDSRKPLSTIPLRSCCPDCVSITEECLKEGEAWVEKFTKGARRRRNSSADSQTDCGFSSIVSSPQDPTVVRLGSLSSIKVDEVDSKRRSSEHAAASVIRTSPLSSPNTLSSPTIIEEDEDQLFPLPSPRRTPTASPANSATASPLPSPNASTSHLTSEIPEEGILAQSLARKGKGRCEKGFLTPDAEARPSLSELSKSVAAICPEEEPLAGTSSSVVWVDSPPLSPVPSTKSHSRSPERRRGSGSKERRPSFGASVLRATGDMLKGISGVGVSSGGLGSSGSGIGMSNGMSV
ncbi:hypothetical protein GYMLUDRAFT_238473 [Collybiopsis luxurians FD-317 M1]|nr:hypothetical protein GYMLUDRAFT_238473 [Collybiopsis luxurians FD-317 M1]